MRNRADILEDILKEQDALINLQEKQIQNLTKGLRLFSCISTTLLIVSLIYLIVTYGEPSIVEAIAVRIGGEW